MSQRFARSDSAAYSKLWSKHNCTGTLKKNLKMIINERERGTSVFSIESNYQKHQNSSDIFGDSVLII